MLLVNKSRWRDYGAGVISPQEKPALILYYNTVIFFMQIKVLKKNSKDIEAGSFYGMYK
jgi:hypothetical protein